MAENAMKSPETGSEVPPEQAKLCALAKDRPETVVSWLKQDNAVSSALLKISA